MNKASRWHKTFHPLWKLATGSLLTFYGLFALVRELFDEKIQKMLTIGNIIDSIPWFVWIISGLVLFIVLKINDVGKILKTNDKFAKIIAIDAVDNVLLDRRISNIESLPDSQDPLAPSKEDMIKDELYNQYIARKRNKPNEDRPQT